MTAFADSSAVVKLYADEADHDVVRVLPVMVVSQLARVEVPSAIWRKQSDGVLAVEEAAILTAEFEADWYGDDEADSRFLVAVVNDEVLGGAARLASVHGLRAYDAVQLATACLVRDVDPECREFAAFDFSLRRAAAAEGFALLP